MRSTSSERENTSMPKCLTERFLRNSISLLDVERSRMNVIPHILAVLAVILCVRVVPVSGDLDRYCTVEDITEGPVRGGHCGSGLADLVQTVCRIFDRSRRTPAFKNNQKRVSVRDLMLTKANALSYLIKRESIGTNQGITCECCFNVCSVSEMAEYCPVMPSQSRS